MTKFYGPRAKSASATRSPVVRERDARRTQAAIRKLTIHFGDFGRGWATVAYIERCQRQHKKG